MTQNFQTQTNPEKPQPQDKVTIGNVRATIWANIGEGGRTNHAISVVKYYKDQEGNWRETNSYFPEDLPKLAMAVTRAYEKIYSRANERQVEESKPTHSEKVKAGRRNKPPTPGK